SPWLWRLRFRRANCSVCTTAGSRRSLLDRDCCSRVLSGFSGERMSRPSHSRAEDRASSKAAGQGRWDFPTTHWSQVRAAGESVAEGDDAFAALCNDYWPPIFAYVRRLGFSEADAQDLTQGFFVHLLEHRTVRRADP